MMSLAPEPTQIDLHRAEKTFEIAFDDDTTFRMPFEYLRVFSPSAEVRGHTPDQATLQKGKKDVDIKAVEAVGNYAVKIVFDDGHNTGLYTWEWLYELGTTQQAKWATYLKDLEAAGGSREAAARTEP